jgi:hypothetical protein
MRVGAPFPSQKRLWVSAYADQATAYLRPSYLLTHLLCVWRIALNRANIWVTNKSKDDLRLCVSLESRLKTAGVGAAIDISRFCAVNVNSTQHMFKDVLCAGATPEAFIVDEVASLIAKAVPG